MAKSFFVEKRKDKNATMTELIAIVDEATRLV